jgi:hypothetical protein
MYFRLDGLAHEAAIGTYCWFPAGCVDAIGPITPAEPVRAHVPTDLRLEVSANLPVTSASLYAHPVRMADAHPITVGRWKGDLAWNRFRGLPIHLPVLPVRDQTVSLDLPPGLHVLSFSVHWQGRGDANYGLLVDVEPAQALYLPWMTARR